MWLCLKSYFLSVLVFVSLENKNLYSPPSQRLWSHYLLQKSLAFLLPSLRGINLNDVSIRLQHDKLWKKWRVTFTIVLWEGNLLYLCLLLVSDREVNLNSSIILIDSFTVIDFTRQQAYNFGRSLQVWWPFILIVPIYILIPPRFDLWNTFSLFYIKWWLVILTIKLTILY